MSDRIAVFNAGAVQLSTPTELYRQPTSFVASFIGENNPDLRHGQAFGGGGEVMVALRPLLQTVQAFAPDTAPEVGA